MLRAIASLLLAAALVAAGAASAAHVPTPGEPVAVHHHASDGYHHDATNVAAVAVAECCDALGAKPGGSCLADATLSALVLLGLDKAGKGRAISLAASVLQGVPPPVPTGPPKV